MTKMRCGDHVRHLPSGEQWTVAYADYQADGSGRLSWFGWPEGEAKIADCELVEACTDEEHEAAITQWVDRLDRRNQNGYDHRPRLVALLYRPAALIPDAERAVTFARETLARAEKYLAELRECAREAKP